MQTPEKAEVWEMIQDLVFKVGEYKNTHIKTYKSIIDKDASKISVRLEYDKLVKAFLNAHETNLESDKDRKSRVLSNKEKLKQTRKDLIACTEENFELKTRVESLELYLK